jgi:1-acyl-sn-glycerol-3-phosphate acyltransferase
VSDSFYFLVRCVGRRIFWLSSRPLVLHTERVPTEGPFLLVCNHTSPFDVPFLIRHTEPYLDFVSSTEVFSHWFMAWFYGSMNAFPLDRSRRDSSAVRTILDRLGRGRPVAMFPEGQFRRGAQSVVHGGALRRGFGRIAQLASVPVVPAVTINSGVYGSISSWLPLKRIRYGLAFGAPLTVRTDLDSAAAAEAMEQEVKSSMMSLHRELAQEMKQRFGTEYD